MNIELEKELTIRKLMRMENLFSIWSFGMIFAALLTLLLTMRTAREGDLEAAIMFFSGMVFSLLTAIFARMVSIECLTKIQIIKSEES